MNNYLAPTFKKLFGDYWILWYAKSNSYSIVESKFKSLIDYYIESDTKAEFESKISKDGIVSDSTILIDTIVNYLEDCNKPFDNKCVSPITIDKSHRNIFKQYRFKDRTIQIYYDSELVSKIIHPALAHCCLETDTSSSATFDIYLEKDELFLFKNEQLISRVPKHNYHLIQGKFSMQLLCTLYSNTEQDWISTFHGSTITDGNSSILFVGASGKGKSTLCAILAANGFNLLADDVSPMLSKNRHIYFNPSAISIKKGSFKVLEPMVQNFKNLPVTKFVKTKGELKYVPYSAPEKDHYPCKAIVLVNYENNSEIKLDSVSIKTLLETLIPESWLSPNSLHAEQFLNWLSELKIYQLTYSNSNSVITEVSELFKRLNK